MRVYWIFAENYWKSTHPTNYISMNKQKAHIQQKVATMNLNDSTVLLMIKAQCWEQLGLLFNAA